MGFRVQHRLLAAFRSVADLVADLRGLDASKRANGEGSIYTDTRGRPSPSSEIGQAPHEVARNMTHAKRFVHEMLVNVRAGVLIHADGRRAFVRDGIERGMRSSPPASTTAGRYSWIVALLSADHSNRPQAGRLADGTRRGGRS